MAHVIEQITNLSYETALEVARCGESTPLVLQNYVNGEYSGPSQDWLESINPQTGKCFARIPKSSEDEVALAVEAADKASASWSKSTKSYRARLLNKIADLIEAKKETFAIWESIN
jgi:aminomuconate-semialdehyde dehydrogenase